MPPLAPPPPPPPPPPPRPPLPPPPPSPLGQVHGPAGIEKMRAAGRLAAEVLEMAGGLVRPGVTTDAIDRAVHAMCVERGAYPSPLNYGRFPKSVCTSVNECICHGIPDSRVLREGDIVNIDVTVYLEVRGGGRGGGGTGGGGAWRGGTRGRYGDVRYKAEIDSAGMMSMGQCGVGISISMDVLSGCLGSHPPCSTPGTPCPNRPCRATTATPPACFTSARWRPRRGSCARRPRRR